MSANQPQRQHRYGVYGANNNSTGSGSGHHHHQQQHQHHYHHQPTQLTIASFLQKDLLGEAVFANINNGGASSSSNSNAANTRNSNNSNSEHQQHRQQQQQHQQQQATHNQRYHQNYYVSPYHQQQQHQQHQPMIMPHLNYVGSGGVATGAGNGNYSGGGGDLSRLVSNGGNNCTTGSAMAGSSSGQRSYASYAAYHNLANEVSSGVTKNNPIQQLPPRQMRSYATALSSANNKKSYASSTASSCSTSSSKSVSSNSSNASNRQMSNKPTTNQESNKNSSNLNLAIETFPTKSLGISSAQQRGGNHRGHHHHYHHNQHGHHHHHHQHHHHGGGGGGGGHQHNQHAMINAPNMVQHQNYYNLTYVNTDGTAALSGTTTRGCSPAPQTTSTSLSTAAGHSCHSPKAIESNSAGPVAMLMSFNTNPVQYQRFANAQQLSVHHQHQQQQQFHQYQQQQQQQQHQPNFFNKKMMTPLTLAMPSMSPSPAPTGITIPNQQSAVHMSASLHNIICCSQLDEATTAAAAAAATPSAVGNDYDSDTSSTHSCTQSKSKYMSLKPKSSSSSSSSWASVTPTTLSPNHICRHTHTTACGPTSTPFPSPLDYGVGSIGTHQPLSNIHAVQHMAQQQNNTTFKSNNDTTCQQLQQLYRNGGEGGGNVITLLNLPTQSSNNLIDDEFHNQHHLYFGSASSDHLNATTTALTNCVNNGFDYWTPTHHSNPILYHLSSAQVPIIAPPKATSSTSSCCGSSPAPSPSGERAIANDMQQQQQQQQLLHNNVVSVSSSLSPTTVCVNEQFTPLVIGGNNFANETEATAVGNILPRNSICNSLPDSDCAHDIDVSSTGEGSNHNKE